MQTQPNIHLILQAIAELEKHPVVKVYTLLVRSIQKPEAQK